MSAPDLGGFREVRIEDRPLLAPMLLESDRISCDYNFSNLYIWCGIYDIRWAMLDGRLLIYGGRDDVMLMPVGPAPAPGEMVEISDACIRQGKSGRFVLVDELYLERNPGMLEFFSADYDAENADYVYSARALVELKGRKLHKKKNLLSQFLRNNPGYGCRGILQPDFEECFKLAEKWCRIRSCEIIGFEHETSALKRAFERFMELELEGLVVLVGDKPIAFSVFERQNRNTAVVHFEKYDPAVKGSAQVMNWETARRLADKYEYINREQDLGIEGLRRAKQSYCPAFMVKTYRLNRKHF